MKVLESPKIRIWNKDCPIVFAFTSFGQCPPTILSNLTPRICPEWQNSQYSKSSPCHRAYNSRHFCKLFIYLRTPPTPKKKNVSTRPGCGYIDTNFWNSCARLNSAIRSVLLPLIFEHFQSYTIPQLSVETFYIPEHVGEWIRRGESVGGNEEAFQVAFIRIYYYYFFFVLSSGISRRSFVWRLRAFLCLLLAAISRALRYLKENAKCIGFQVTFAVTTNTSRPTLFTMFRCVSWFPFRETLRLIRGFTDSMLAGKKSTGV